LAELAAGARFEKRVRGETLFRAGDAGDRLFVLRRGAVELARRGERRTLRPPAHFGERAAITGEPRSDSARVLEDAELLTLDSSAFRAVLLQNPFLALELGKGLSGPRQGET
jgi:CRP-like cAMP-binding protein